MSDFRRLSDESEFSGVLSDDVAFSCPYADGSLTTSALQLCRHYQNFVETTASVLPTA